MKVILRKDVGGVGTRDSVCEVSDGYALNFLIPRRLAEQATPQNVAELETRKKKESAEVLEREAQWESELKKLEGVTVVVSSKANETGRLYRELKGERVAESIKKEHGIDVPADAIRMDTIKQTGEFKATVRLGRSSADIHVRVEGA